MLIHFAFRKFRNNPKLQLENAINNIFKEKRLLYSKNPEFIPRLLHQYHPKFTGVKSYQIPIHIVSKGANYIGIDTTKQIKSSSNYFNYIREDVRMICFTDISLDSLESSSHLVNYGKLGIVFCEEFLNRHRIKKVKYFKESELFNDQNVLRWNFLYAYQPNLSNEEKLKKRTLELEILLYRKPVKMFKSFKKLRRLNLNKMNIEDVYKEYKIGYDFQKEKEWRLVSPQNDYLNFSESDLSIVFVSSNKIREELTKYFKNNWGNPPEVKIFK